jgi:hypothetical protein
VIGLVLANAGLIEDLRASRQRLVTAQDEARRRLERNLHDGAQQDLVALAIKAQLADVTIDEDPPRGRIRPRPALAWPPATSREFLLRSVRPARAKAMRAGGGPEAAKTLAQPVLTIAVNVTGRERRARRTGRSAYDRGRD